MSVPTPDAWDRTVKSVRDYESRAGGGGAVRNYEAHPEPGTVTVRITGGREDMDTSDLLDEGDSLAPAHDKAGVYQAVFVYRNVLWDGLDDDPAWFDGDECYVQEINDKAINDEYCRGHVVGTYKDKALVLVEAVPPIPPSSCSDCGWLLDSSPLTTGAWVGSGSGSGSGTLHFLKVTIPKALGRCSCIDTTQGTGVNTMLAFYSGLAINLLGDLVDWYGFTVPNTFHTCCGCATLEFFVNPGVDTGTAVVAAYDPNIAIPYAPMLAKMTVGNTCQSGTRVYWLKFECCQAGVVTFSAAGGKLCDGTPSGCDNSFTIKAECVSSCDWNPGPCSLCKTTSGIPVIIVEPDDQPFFAPYADYDGAWALLFQGETAGSGSGSGSGSGAQCTYSVTCRKPSGQTITVTLVAWASSVFVAGPDAWETQTNYLLTYSGAAAGTVTYTKGTAGLSCSPGTMTHASGGTAGVTVPNGLVSAPYSCPLTTTCQYLADHFPHLNIQYVNLGDCPCLDGITHHLTGPSSVPGDTAWTPIPPEDIVLDVGCGSVGHCWPSSPQNAAIFLCSMIEGTYTSQGAVTLIHVDVTAPMIVFDLHLSGPGTTPAYRVIVTGG